MGKSSTTSVQPPLKILGLKPDNGGCGWYRVRQPLAMIKNHTEHDAFIIDDDTSPLDALIATAHADIIVARQGTPIKESKRRLTELLDNLNKERGTDLTLKAKWVMDIDDNMEYISPFSNHYQDHGTKEVKVGNTWLWRDGYKNFNIKENEKRLNDHFQNMADADLVTVTTEKLAEHARKYNPNVAVLNNYVDRDRWWHPNFKDNDVVRIGWSGGSSHYEDLEDTRKVLLKLASKYDFKIVIAGHHFPGAFKGLEDRVETHDWVPFKGHSYRMMCLNIDFALIPLTDNEFNIYKSPIKWVEFAAMGVPSVVRDMLPYSKVADTTNSVPYKTEKQLYKALESLILDKNRRKSLGVEALRSVKSSFYAQDRAVDWVKAYKSILD